MVQETLIYIDDSEKTEASAAANTFANSETRNRAYFNTLGAELALKYMLSENIDISNIRNIHSIKKILEEIDISDIMLENIHIDVRVVFDDSAIFIPKSHFEYNLVPDIYLVFNLAKDFSHVKFLGFFEPQLINKNNENSSYYFIEKEKLSSPLDLKNYVENFSGTTDEQISDEEAEKLETIMISLADNDVSEEDKKYLLQQLTKSAALRDKFIEYENFENLSYRAMSDPLITKKEFEENSQELDIFETFDSCEEVEEEFHENTEIEQPDEINTTFEPLDTELEPAEESIPFENIDIPLENSDEQETEIESISLDNVETPVDISEEVYETELEEISVDDVEEKEIITDEFTPETISFENIESQETLPEEDTIVQDTISIENIETSDTEIEQPDFSEETLFEDIAPTEEQESVQEPSESFGRNLLENLALEDDVEISNNLYEQTEEVPYQPDELSSIDDTMEDIPPVDPEPVTAEAEEEEISQPETVEPENVSGEESYENDLPQETYAQENENKEEEIPDTNIDDLLNMVDNIQEENSAVYDQNIEDDSQIGVLFNDTDHDADAEINNINSVEETETKSIPGAALFNKNPHMDKKALIAAGLVIAVIAGVSMFHFLKPKNETIEPIVNTPSEQDNILDANIPEVNTSIADIEKPVEVQTSQSTQELKNTAAKPVSSESYLNVNKLVWDVPDTLSYSTKMQNYLRTAGKSIKLSLSADLLLVTEYAYTNQVKVGLKLSKTGNIQDAKIITSSGSTQIDNIVLQSVKDTLNVVKPPAGEISTPDFNLSLIIYF